MPIISGSSGGGAGNVSVLFSSTLGADAAAIDTGANGIAGGFSALIVEFLGQTADVAASGNINILVNNDSSAIYDIQFLVGINVTPTSGISVADTKWQLGIHGQGGTATYPSAMRIDLPGYAATTFSKLGIAHLVKADATAGNQGTLTAALGYRGTSAITRLSITGATANLKSGSLLRIYGLT